VGLPRSQPTLRSRHKLFAPDRRTVRRARCSCPVRGLLTRAACRRACLSASSFCIGKGGQCSRLFRGKYPWHDAGEDLKRDKEEDQLPILESFGESIVERMPQSACGFAGFGRLESRPFCTRRFSSRGYSKPTARRVYGERRWAQARYPHNEE